MPGFHEEFHDGVLGLRELDALAVFVQRAVARVEQEGPALELRLLRLLVRADAPVERVHAREQLRRGEGLCDIVVRARHQARDLVHLLAQRREHDYAHLGAGGPDAAADLKAVYVRQHDVQQRHAYVVVFLKQAKRLLARGRLNRLVARAPEIYDDKAADAGFVLEHQYLLDVVHAPFLRCFMPKFSARTL